MDSPISFPRVIPRSQSRGCLLLQQCWQMRWKWKFEKCALEKVKFVGQVLLPGQAGSVRIRRFFRWSFIPWNSWMYRDFSLNYFIFSSQTKTLMGQSSCCWDNTSWANLRSFKNLPVWFCISRGNHRSDPWVIPKKMWILNSCLLQSWRASGACALGIRVFGISGSSFCTFCSFFVN